MGEAVAGPQVRRIELASRRTTRQRGLQYAVKRVSDFLIAAIALVVAAPLGLLIAPLIKLDSRGGIFFLQERVGRDGKRFRVVKFRTMYDGSSEHFHREFVRQQLSDHTRVAAAAHGNGSGNGDGPNRANGNGKEGPAYKLSSDPRVTPLGRLLRRTSLDELPQLINVLRGEMSIVGPRPPLVYELEDYEQWQFERLSVMPGITGLWQVSGRSSLSYRRMCELDLEYIRRWSLWLDVKILFKTVPVVLFHTSWAA